MANRTFDRTLEKFNSTDYNRHSKEAFDWFRRYVTKNLRPTMRNVFNSGEWTGSFTSGNMYTYIYDAKTKEKLPFWDAHPLIIFLHGDNANPRNFWGVNLHYMAPVIRQKLFQEMIKTLSNNRLDETTKIRANYARLRSMIQSKYVEQSVKQYSKDQIRSMIIKVDPQYWEILTFLPYARFQKN